MKPSLPTFVAAAVLATGCTSILPTTTPIGSDLKNVSNLVTVAPLSSTEAALKTKEGLASLNSALASLRDLKGSAAVTHKGSAAELQQAAGYRLTSALSTEEELDEELPDIGYNQVQWFYDVESSVTNETQTDYVLTEQILEEGRVASGDTTVVVERYTTTVTTRIPLSTFDPDSGGEGGYSGAWGTYGGTYTRDEQVTVSEFRKLGRYVTSGTMSVVNGKPALEAIQDFTPKGGTKTHRLTFRSTFADNTMAFEVKGDAPDGGSLDLKSTAAFSMSGGSSSGTFTQQGTIVTAKGETILVDCSVTMSSTFEGNIPVFTTKGGLSLTFKDKLVLKFDLDQSSTEDKTSGAIYAADGTTRMGTIAINSSNPEGVVTFNDGTTQTINMQTIGDLMSIATSVSL